MKIDIAGQLVDDLTTQLAATRDVYREKNNDTVEWDRSALGQLYSILVQETGGRSCVSKKSSSVNRKQASSRFKR